MNERLCSSIYIIAYVSGSVNRFFKEKILKKDLTNIKKRVNYFS